MKGLDITPLLHNKSSKSLDAWKFSAISATQKLDRFARFSHVFLLSQGGVLDAADYSGDRA